MRDARAGVPDRLPEHDGTAGAAAALSDCAALIVELTRRATGGRDVLAPWTMEPVPVFKVARLPFYHKQWRVSGGLGWRF